MVIIRLRQPRLTARMQVRVYTLLLPALAACYITLSPLAARADDADSRFVIATGQYAQSFNELALKNFQGYLDASPEGAHAPQARFMVGECYYQLKDWQKASKAYGRFLDRHDDTADRPVAEAHLGDSLFNLNQFEEAAASFKKAVGDSTDPKVTSYASYWYAESLFQQKDYDDAAKGYSVVLDKYPTSEFSSFALLAEGICLSELKQPKEAAAVFTKFLTRYPKSDSAAEAAFRLGDALYTAKDYPGSAAAYQKVLDNFPNSDFAADATDGLAWAKLKAGQYAEAAPLFSKVAAASKDRKTADEAALQAGICYAKAPDLEKARAAWAPLLARTDSPFAAEASFRLARALLDAKQYSDAVQAFRSFLDTYPNDTRVGYAWAGRGDAAAAVNQYVEAADAYAHAAKTITEPDLKLAVLTGQLWADQKLGHGDEASTVRAQIMREFPNSKEASTSQLTEADAAFADKHYEAALALYQKYIQANPGAAETARAAFKGGMAKIKLGRTADAAASFAFLARKFPDSPLIPDGLAALADAYFTAKDYDSAIPVFGNLIKDYPRSAAAPWALYGRASAQILKAQASGAMKNPDAATIKELDASYADFAQLSADYPTDPNAPEASFQTGWIRQKEGRTEDAIADFHKSLAYFPRGPFAEQARFLMGGLLVKADRISEATDTYEDLVKSAPTSTYAPRALNEEAWALVKAKKLDNASEVFARLLKEYPDASDDGEATAELGSLKLNSTPPDLDGAETLLQKTIDTYPTLADLDKVQYNLALTQYKKGNFAAAGASFQKLTDAYPHSDLEAEAIFWGAESYSSAHTYDKALPLYLKVLNATAPGPHAAAASFGAARAQKALGHNAEAVPLFNKAAELDGAQFGAMAECGAGESLLAEQKPTEALEAFFKVVALYPDNHEALDEAQFGIGQACEQQKEWSKAVDAYTKVAQSPTPGPWTDQAKSRLDEIKKEHATTG